MHALFGAGAALTPRVELIKQGVVNLDEGRGATGNLPSKAAFEAIDTP